MKHQEKAVPSRSETHESASCQGAVGKVEGAFGLTNGDIFHGRLSLDQMYSARPVLGYGNYRSPIEGLYMCGSGTHPGGGVTGVPGHNAAQEIIRDG